MRVKHKEPAMARASDRPETRDELRARRKLFMAIAADRIASEDWHGVRDAAADLGEIDAAPKVLG